MGGKLKSFAVVVAATAVAGIAFASQALYDEQADAHQQIAAAIAQASKAHKNIVLDFGANWCEDCHVLEAQIERPELAGLIAKSFVVVKVDVGRFDKNLDLAAKYHVPLKKGIPALAVLGPHGKLLYSQEQGEFEDARNLSFDSIRAFFERWQPKRS